MVQIVTLIENLVYATGLTAEHGLAIFIDTGKRKVLFDTGQSAAFLANAKQLGIDLSAVDALVLSHGHYDHTGGLSAFLRENSKARIYLKNGLFAQKYHHFDRFIGTPALSEAMQQRVTYVEGVTPLCDSLYIVPDIPVVNPIDTSFRNFYLREGETFVPDRFHEELFLAVVSGQKLSVISSCSHRGITNIMTRALQQFPLPIDLILGGFHLLRGEPERDELVVEALCRLHPERIGVCHCTGLDAYIKLAKAYTGNLFYNHTGYSLNL